MRQPEAPETIERHQSRSGIRAAAAQPAAHGDSLVYGDTGPARDARMLAQQLRRTHDQIRFGGHAGQVIHTHDAPVLASFDTDPVAQIDETENALQEVITVRAPA